MTRILVVEDDPAILRGLSDNLKLESYEVATAVDGEAGYRLACEAPPDLIVLDLMLPKLSGYELCRKLRSDGVTTPILMLTARGEEADRVLGLDLGADDYVTKPFSIRELLARVRAILRRTQSPAAPPDEVRFADVTVDFRSYEARREGDAGRDDAEGVPAPAASGGPGGRGGDPGGAAERGLGIRQPIRTPARWTTTSQRSGPSSSRTSPGPATSRPFTASGTSSCPDPRAPGLPSRGIRSGGRLKAFPEGRRI